nr:uncharacterized protein LOC109780176 [Aegilops tauschii subsp. strangulata]
MDVSNAFQHGHLSEQVFCQQPTGFVDAAHSDHACLLSRSLYGLKQAPRAWYQRIAAFLEQLGFRATRSDASLFVYHQGQATAYLLLYVDNIILRLHSIVHCDTCQGAFSVASLSVESTDKLATETAPWCPHAAATNQRPMPPIIPYSPTPPLATNKDGGVRLPMDLVNQVLAPSQNIRHRLIFVIIAQF